MKITCESCGAKYTIADDKVRGRKVKIRCKGCGTPIVVDGQTSGPASGEAASSEPDAGVSDAPTSMVPEAEWSVNLSDTEQVSLSTAQIVEGWQAGTITADAFVWKDGMGDWIPILDSPELAPLLSGAQAGPPAAAVEAAPPVAASMAKPSLTENGAAARIESKSVRPAARAIKPTGAAARTAATAARVTGRAQGAQDLFAGVERAGADEEEVQTSAPVLPQAGGKAAPQEEKATGARNENSVLFSLDALKAGFSGPSKAESTRPAPSTASDDPFGMGSAPAVASLGGGNSLFSLAQNQALLTAPAPAEPPPQRIAPAAMAGGHVSAAPPPSQKRLILFAALGIGILGVGLALGIGLSGGNDDKDKASAETATLADKAKEEPKPAEEAKKEEPAKEEPKPAEEAKKEEPAKDPTAGEPEKTEAKPEETAKGPSTPGPAPGGAAKAVAKEPKEEPKPPADAQPFSKGAAVAALSAAATSAASCKKIGGPTGSGKVTVTFAPSGRVTSANVNGAPFAGTSVGGCVASIFRRAKVPPFSGTQITVAKSFTIR